MADPVEIQGTDTQAKNRNPLVVIGLGFVTLGIYFAFWYYFVNKEMAEVGRARNTDELGDSPGTSVLAVTLGALLIVPPFVSVYHAWMRLNSGERLTGLTGMEAGLGLILWIFISPVAIYIFQSNWNKVLEAQTGVVSAQVGPSADPQAIEATPAAAK
jgi:Domain of unknown function (DUF4234)